MWKFWIAIAAVSLLLLGGPSLAAPVAEGGPARRAAAQKIGPGSGEVPVPRVGFDRPEVQVLLSSIDMTVSLIDAYGRCRDEDNGHEACMQMIRNTLEEARNLIGH